MMKWTKVRGVKIGTLGLLLSLGLVFLDVNTARAIEHPPLLIHCYTFILFPETLNPPTSLNLPLPEANAAEENDSVEVGARNPVSNDDIRRWIEVIERQKKNIEAHLEKGEYGPRSEPLVRESVSKIARTIAWLERIASGTNTENDPTITWGVLLVTFAGENAHDALGIYNPARHEVVLNVDMRPDYSERDTSGDSFSPALVAGVVAHEYSHAGDTEPHRPSLADVIQKQLAKLFDRQAGPPPKRDPTRTGWETEGLAYFLDALLYSNSDESDFLTNQFDETTFAPLNDIQISSEGERKLGLLRRLSVNRHLLNDNPEEAMWIALDLDPRSEATDNEEPAEISGKVNPSLIPSDVSRVPRDVPSVDDPFRESGPISSNTSVPYAKPSAFPFGERSPAYPRGEKGQRGGVSDYAEEDQPLGYVEQGADKGKGPMDPGDPGNYGGAYSPANPSRPGYVSDSGAPGAQGRRSSVDEANKKEERRRGAMNDPDIGPGGYMEDRPRPQNGYCRDADMCVEEHL